MFGEIGGMMEQFQMMQKLMKDENFKVFITHPKVQELFKDPEFKEIAKTKQMMKIVQYPKFAGLLRDPEVAPLMAKINPQAIMSGMK